MEDERRPQIDCDMGSTSSVGQLLAKRSNCKSPAATGLWRCSYSMGAAFTGERRRGGEKEEEGDADDADDDADADAEGFVRFSAMADRFMVGGLLVSRRAATP